MTAPTVHRTASDPDLELDGFVAAFEAAAASDPHADPAAFVPPADHPRHVEILAELLRVDLELAWDRGERRRADTYPARFPALAAHPSVLREVLREEARLRAADGPDAAVLPNSMPTDRMPEPGEVVAGFVLERELGRGAFGRVFLGRQSDLADRPVAVKVSAKFPGEWRTLARLQHAHVVPVYSVHRHGRFHVACMPYLGRTTLADLIGRWRASTLNAAGGPTAPASGNEPIAPPRPADPTPTPTVPDHPDRVRWVLTLGAQLAAALAHAHERGVLHRDIKPANVLLTDDGRPMLLDFNLAADAGETTSRDVGGTPRYMAPEQLAALAGDRGADSERSDVYALGLVLCELLSGRLPFDDPHRATPDSLAELAAVRSNPLDPARLPDGISPAVASILSTALAPDPARRYPSAAALRDDLERQLADRPLAFAPERSVRERFAKWRRRHPRLSSWFTVTALAAAVVLAVVGGFLWRQRHFDAVAATNHLHRLADVRGEVRARLTTRGGPKAEYAEAAAECEAVLSDLPAPAEPAWGSHPLVRPLTDADRRTAAAVVNELRWLKAAADRLSGSTTDDRALLAAARAAINPDGRYAMPDEVTASPKAARDALPAMRAAARTESGRWEYWHRLALCERRAGDLSAARAHFRLAADLDDDCPWSLFHLGATALDAKEWKAAAAAFDEFMTKRDTVPEAYLNRAIARIRLNDLAGALADLDRIEPHAVQLPRFHFTRAEAKRRKGDAKGAAADLAAGLKLEPTDAVGWNARGEAKLTLTPPDAKGALADFERAKELDPDLPTTYQNLAAVFGEHMNRPADAVKAWDDALARFPDLALALGGRAVYLARLGKRDDARRDADAAVQADPAALVCYQAACAYLLTAETEADRRSGLALLRQALRADPSWGAVMPTDRDLQSVWKSDDFRELVRAAGVLTAK